MNREEFIHNYISITNGCIWSDREDGEDILKSLIGSIYDQQQMIEYLDNRIIDLERIVYAS